jgi:Uma2 family endonuclease
MSDMAIRSDDARLGLTVREWKELDDPPGYKFAIIGGELDVTPGATPEHGRALGELYVELCRSLPDELQIVIDVDWHLESAARVTMAPRPDLMVIPLEGRVVPVLVVEVLSPSDHHLFRGTRLSRIQAKRLDYAEAGLEHYLEVDMATVTITRYRLRDGVLERVDSTEQDELMVADEPFLYCLAPSSVLNGDRGHGTSR